jgi:hypothetical protein
MNPNRYPSGRWTTRARPARRAAKIEPQSLAALREAPLRELFWAADESGLVVDARARIEALLSNALAAVTLAPVDSLEASVLPAESELAAA